MTVAARVDLADGVPSFLDTNILIYAYDPDDRRKQGLAQQILDDGVIFEATVSTQVLGEFATALLYRASVKRSPAQVLECLRRLQVLRVIEPVPETIQRAVTAHERYGIHFYDGMIVAAAERAGCTRILSEDLSDGQEYFGIRVVNPFA